jgi:peptide/nickel transport system ATP-binding protein
VSFELTAHETLAIVGESGSGKSTLLRAIAGHHPWSHGSVHLQGEPLAKSVGARRRVQLRAIQLVFQSPQASLNPRHSVAELVGRPLRLFQPDLSRVDRRREIQRLLRDVSLDDTVLVRRPWELSGGQQQRVAIARAFATSPDVLVCDEVVSALDVSVAAAVLRVLAKIASERGTAIVFVTHNLAVVRSVADRVAVMRAGRFIELGSAREVFERPKHPYTSELLEAARHATIVSGEAVA